MAALHTPEMFLRWLQWGLFSPAFRTHCVSTQAVCYSLVFSEILPDRLFVMQAGCELRPWLFPNFEELRPVYQLRSRDAAVPLLRLSRGHDQRSPAHAPAVLRLAR